MDLLKLTALELGRKIKAGEVTVREAVRAVIEQAKEVEPTINSYVTLDEEGAYAQADEIQKKIDAGVSWFMTQPIYSDEEVEKLARMKRELDTKILCGIMPLVSYRNAMFIKNEMPGIHVPDEIVEQYRPDMSRAEAEAVAVDISLAVIDKLKDVADGFYFMTPFNRVELICRIIDKMEK